MADNSIDKEPLTAKKHMDNNLEIENDIFTREKINDYASDEEYLENKKLEHEGNKMEIDNEEVEISAEKNINCETNRNDRKGFIRIPLAKIKNISKLDPDNKLCQKNAYLVIGKMTELFIQEVARESVTVAKIKKRKTLNIEDMSCALKSSEKYNFIDMKSIFSYETIEDLKEKEEKLERKMKKIDKINETNSQNEPETNEERRKIKDTNSLKQTRNLKKAEGNMRIDSMFSISHS